MKKFEAFSFYFIFSSLCSKLQNIYHIVLGIFCNSVVDLIGLYWMHLSSVQHSNFWRRYHQKCTQKVFYFFKAALDGRILFQKYLNLKRVKNHIVFSTENLTRNLSNSQIDRWSCRTSLELLIKYVCEKWYVSQKKKNQPYITNNLT